MAMKKTLILYFYFLNFEPEKRFIFCFILQYSTVLHGKITVKNKAGYFVDFTYRGLFLECIPHDKRGFIVHTGKFKRLFTKSVHFLYKISWSFVILTLAQWETGV